MAETIRIERRIPVALAGEGWQDPAVQVRIIGPQPGKLAARPAVLFCFPGGTMTKEYFDLDAEGDRSFSFAEAMAGRGHITVSLDHLGVGGSSRPDDGFRLHPEVVAGADAQAIAAVKRMLGEGLEGYGPLGAFTSIGVGHSMGGMLMSWAQVHHGAFDAAAILGAGPYGLYEHLPEPMKPLAYNPEAARRELEPKLRAMGVPPFQTLTPNAETRRIFHSGDRRGVKAMAKARGELISMCGMFVMIPGSWSPEAAAIRTPVFLAFGDQDICQDPSSVPAFFKSAPDVRLVVLPKTGHSHFVFPSREQLFDEMEDWIGRQAQGAALQAG